MLQRVFGQESYGIATEGVEAWVTRKGGHLAPVTFRIGNRNIQPFSIAPWAEEAGLDLPPIIEALRGDFFCMPFGANQVPFEGELHPIHGETANADWTLVEQTATKLTLEMTPTVRPGKVRKEIELRAGQSVIYSRHTISEMRGPMSLGHHAMLKFQEEGLVSTGPFGFGQVFPGAFELPAEGGYSSLKRGAMFESLAAVPLAEGGYADLTRYPARDGFEDLVMVYSPPGDKFGWSAVTFPEQGYIWFALKDPRVLSGTILWHSNGGRHYAPWSGRHRAVLGIEDVTASMHFGLAGSVAENDASRAGYRTSVVLDQYRPFVVNYITGIVEAPRGACAIAKIQPGQEGVELTLQDGSSLFSPLDLEFLYQGS